jgi:hypothetical protein
MLSPVTNPLDYLQQSTVSSTRQRMATDIGNRSATLVPLADP